MSNFITNDQTRDLKKRLIELIQKSEELKFLVGFFYFSGIRELYDGLRNNPGTVTKVLVGLNVDHSNYGLIELADNQNLSDEEKSYKFFESIKKSLNTEYFDTEEFYTQVRFFMDLIRHDKLVIRKTSEPNHAKLYLFKLDQSQVGKKKLFITGSSNLTKAGLFAQNEFNVEIGDYGFEEAEKYFDDLWAEAVKITEHADTKVKLIDVIENGTLIKDMTPFEAYCVLLKTYLDSFEQKEINASLVKILLDNGYKDYRYQRDAVGQALAIIENNNGVVIADVVGLGKTIIACAIAKQLKKRGIIICPPGLTGDRNKESGWEKYKEQFKLHDWDVRSLGDLENTLDYVQRTKEIEVVIVDEAHRFRNQDTKDYELLKNICREKIVILLTATPFNNRPGDILSLLKLFITPKKSSITLESNLVDQFKGFKGIFDRSSYIKKYHNAKDQNKRSKAINYYKGIFGEDAIDLTKVTKRARYLAKQIRNVIEPVTIRRNRLDLQTNPYYKDEVKDLSTIEPPKEWFFELSKQQLAFYTTIIEDYFGDPEENGRFKGAIYRPYEYEKGEKEKLSEEENRQLMQQRNLFDFMRRLIVKRFESSFGSFEQSIKNFRKITTTAQAFIKKTDEYILDRALLEKIYDMDMEAIEAYLLDYEEKIKKGEYPKNHKRYKVNDFDDKKKFLDHIQSDIELFDGILDELNKLKLVMNDPKTACLVSHVKEEFAKKPVRGEPKRKIVIFSEYVDTVIYLEKELIKHYGDRVLVVAGDLPSSKIALINKNFDASYKDQSDDYDILLSSDKISEGFNLNRAGMVINYDIPWNPVRVIQRVGRINRISKKVFDKLSIVNFFPTETGAELVKSREIAQNKMFLIHTALGEDAKIFHVDEEPTPAGLYQRIQQNPDDKEEASFYTKALKEYLSLMQQHPEILANINKYPPRIKVAKKYSKNELLVFFKKGRMYVVAAGYGANDKVEPEQTTFEEVFDRISCTIEQKKLPLSKGFWPAYEAVKTYKNYRLGPVSENSLEQKALNKLDYMIKTNQSDALMPYKDFMRMLREDILNYGTLADYTMRRIANLQQDEKRVSEAVEELKALVKEMGLDYLDKEKARQKEPNKEIIIAVENQAS